MPVVMVRGLNEPPVPWLNETVNGVVGEAPLGGPLQETVKFAVLSTSAGLGAEKVPKARAVAVILQLAA